MTKKFSEADKALYSWLCTIFPSQKADGTWHYPETPNTSGMNNTMSNTNISGINNTNGSGNNLFTNRMEKDIPAEFLQLKKIFDSYTVTSPEYKFKHVFYTLSPVKIVKSPEFTEEEWQKYYINEYLMPVILNKDQITMRHDKQNELIMKLNKSKFDINEKLEQLNCQKQVVHNKMKVCIELLRKYIKKKSVNSYECEYVEEEKGFEGRNKFYLRNAAEGLSTMNILRDKLVGLSKKIKEDLKDLEQGGIKRSFIMK